MGTCVIGQPFGYLKDVTLSDTTDNIKNSVFIQNRGTSGSVTIRQSNGYGNKAIWLNQGDSTMVGRFWEGAMATGATAGLELVAFY